MFSGVQQQPTRQRAQSIMPCTVGQITKAEQIDDKFLIGNIELNQVLVHFFFCFLLQRYCGCIYCITRKVVEIFGRRWPLDSEQPVVSYVA